MRIVRHILGNVGDAAFAGRRVDPLSIDVVSASRRRLRTHTAQGVDIAINLEAHEYLRHGAVLDDDGETLVVVDRTPEPALVVSLGAVPGPERVRAAALLGHVFGNQHVPIDCRGQEIFIPITTSAELEMEAVEELGLDGITMRVDRVRLGCDAPLTSPLHRHSEANQMEAEVHK